MAITMTERAVKQVKRLFTEGGMPEESCLRVAIKGGGCSGFNYFLSVATAPADEDEVFTCQEVRLLCDPKSYLYLNGTEIDYDDSLMSRGFVFKNPNAKNSCSCGASFSA
ncbi:MAG: iron-sulfur cluster assembly accessory protein [Phycisphaerae bacterium]|jgi:iron-sulfur cluster assembly protein